MVEVLLLLLHRIGRAPDVVVGADDQARPLAREELLERLDLLRGGLLLRAQEVEAEHEQRVRVPEHPLVEREPVAGLVDPLEHRDPLPGRFPDELLERHPGSEEQLERPRDALEEGQRIARPLEPGQVTRRTSVMVE